MKFYTTDSRTLDAAVHETYEQANKWCEEKSVLHGMEKTDWKIPEYWSGCETPPQIFTENEWAEICQENEISIEDSLPKKGAPIGNKNAQKGEKKADAQIQMRVALAMKSNWVRLAQKEGLKLTDWIIQKCENN